MIDIKYRVWDKDEKCMYQVDSIHFPLGKPSGKDITVYNEKEDYYEWIYNYELIQYSGLQDINKKEIYEGDILKDVYNNISICCWVENVGAYSFIPKELYIKKENCHTYYEDCFDIFEEYGTDCFMKNVLPIKYETIIGSVYENPELLNQI